MIFSFRIEVSFLSLFSKKSRKRKMRSSVISTCLFITCAVVVFTSVTDGKSLQSADNYCPPERTECPFGCCPYSNGTCCSNGFHCCREEEVCSSESGNCLGMDEVGKISLRQAFPLYFPASPSGSSTACPPCTTQCGEDKCCLFRDGTCCTDGVHCCPYNYACDVTRQKCYMMTHDEETNRLEGSNATAEYRLFTAMDKEPYDVVCPGGMRCPRYANCCEDPDYGFLRCCYLLQFAEKYNFAATKARANCFIINRSI